MHRLRASRVLANPRMKMSHICTPRALSYSLVTVSLWFRRHKSSTDMVYVRVSHSPTRGESPWSEGWTCISTLCPSLRLFLNQGTLHSKLRLRDIVELSLKRVETFCLRALELTTNGQCTRFEGNPGVWESWSSQGAS